MDGSKYSPTCTLFFLWLHKKMRWTLSDSRDATVRWAMIRERWVKIHGSMNDWGSYDSRAWPRLFRNLVMRNAIRLPLPIRREREIPLFTSVISYNGSLVPCLTFSSPSPGVDTNLLRGLIFPPVVFCPDWPVICPEPYRTPGTDRRNGGLYPTSNAFPSACSFFGHLRENNRNERTVTVVTLNLT